MTSGADVVDKRIDELGNEIEVPGGPPASRPLENVPTPGRPHARFCPHVLRASWILEGVPERQIPSAFGAGSGSGMLAYIKRTTVKLPDELDARLRHEAQRRGTTVSQLTREAIEAHLGGSRTRRRLLASAAGSSGRSDISERIEEILAGEVSASR